MLHGGLGARSKLPFCPLVSGDTQVSLGGIPGEYDGGQAEVVEKMQSYGDRGYNKPPSTLGGEFPCRIGRRKKGRE